MMGQLKHAFQQQTKRRRMTSYTHIMNTTLRSFGFWCLAHLLVVLLLVESVSTFSLGNASKNNNNKSCWNRRTALENLATIVPVASSLLTSSPARAANDVSSSVCTVVVDSPDTAPLIGIEFVDITIDSGKEVPSVGKVEPNSLASKSGVQPGMILKSRGSATKSSSRNVEFRIRNGPYPFILQLSTKEDMNNIATGDPQRQQQKGEIPLGPYDRLDVKTVQKPPNCNGGSARRGDTVTIAYDARITSSSGPLYDSSSWRKGKPATFELGKGYAVPGVEIGLNGMCVGEVREIDVPTTLGYGKYGSQVFDVEGDVRLWWRVELLELTKGSGGKKSSNWK